MSTDQGLEQDFNSLDAQYDACQAYIRSQLHAGWSLLRAKYDDGGYSGGNTDRPGLQRLLDDVQAEKIDVIVVYKVEPGYPTAGSTNAFGNARNTRGRSLLPGNGILPPETNRMQKISKV